MITELLQLSNPGHSVTGLSDTRLECPSVPITGFSIKCDYIRIVHRFKSIDLLKYFLDNCLNNEPWQLVPRPWSAGRGAKSYQVALESAGGFGGGISLYEKNDNDFIGEIMLNLSGQFLSQIDLENQFKLFAYFKNNNCRCTRLDLALDDFTFNIIPIDDMCRAWELGNISGFQNYDSYSSQKWRDGKLLKRITHYFGSRESEKLTRIYEHEFDGFCSLRYEVEYKRGKASTLFDYLATMGENPDIFSCSFSENISNFLTGGIAFYENKSSNHLDRNDVAPWWQDFINKISDGLQIKIPSPKSPRSVEKSLKWIKRQVLKTLSSLVFAGDFCDDFIQILGQTFLEKCDNYHLMINMYLSNNKHLFNKILAG